MDRTKSWTNKIPFYGGVSLAFSALIRLKLPASNCLLTFHAYQFEMRGLWSRGSV